MLVDSFNRRIEYLRLSITDRCNFRCLYCLPEKYNQFAESHEVLTDNEIKRIVSCFADLGISKVRITGGEPLVRNGVVDLISHLSKIPGISDLSISTNGMPLGKMAGMLKEAGLKRVNISLDSLEEQTFKKITRFGELGTVLDGINAALEAGLSPVKINVVVIRGRNDNEIHDFVKLTEEKPLHVRFIELMPMGETGFFSREKWVPWQEIMKKAGDLKPLSGDDSPTGYGPSRYYRKEGAKGTIGFITPLSCGFCSSCNRIRLSAKGVLFPCLDGLHGIDLMKSLRSGADEAKIKNLILQAIAEKPERHFMVERANNFAAGPRFMCQIGG